MPRLSEVLTGDYLDRPALMSQRIAHILKASTGMLDENYESVSLLLYQPDGVPDTEGWVTEKQPGSELIRDRAEPTAHTSRVSGANSIHLSRHCRRDFLQEICVHGILFSSCELHA
ncbi:MAG TPA: hypothetical protein VFG71_02270 [Nitrospiraceae bacterium]|nr:hypothetical protein [Nitrospiraceae bacterium]